MFEDYYKTKLEAEQFLEANLGIHSACAVRPGLVWHKIDRPYLMPFGFAADILSKVTNSPNGPSTNLSVLTDTICHEIRTPQEESFKLIRASQMKSCSL